MRFEPACALLRMSLPQRRALRGMHPERADVIVAGALILEETMWALDGVAGVLDVARVPAATSIFLPGTGRGFSLGLEWKR